MSREKIDSSRLEKVEVAYSANTNEALLLNMKKETQVVGTVNTRTISATSRDSVRSTSGIYNYYNNVIVVIVVVVI